MIILSTLRTSMIIIISVLAFLCLCGLIFVSYKRYRRHYLRYHKYNLRLIRHETFHKENLVNKKIRYKKNNPLFLSHVKKNVEAINDINIQVTNFLSKSEDIKELKNIAPLSLVQGFKDPQESLLLHDIITLFKGKRKYYFYDEMLLKIYGEKNYLYFKNRYVFFFNQFIINIPIIERLANPSIIKMEKLNVKVTRIKEKKSHNKYSLDIYLSQKKLIHLEKRVKKEDIGLYETLIQMVDYYDVFYKCSSIKEAVTKNDHLKKMNDQTFSRIQSMSGVRFIKWVQDALKSIYKKEPLLKQSSTGSYYLLLPEMNGNLNVVIQVKRHSDNITSTVIKELKDIQGSELGDEAWIITTSSFTKQAQTMAKETNVRLIEGDELMRIIKDYNHNYYRSF